MNCNCEKNNHIQSVCVGYAYVVPQIMGETYEHMAALKNGTMFPELNMPYGCYVPKETKEKMGGCDNDRCN